MSKQQKQEKPYKKDKKSIEEQSQIESNSNKKFSLFEMSKLIKNELGQSQRPSSASKNLQSNLKFLPIQSVAVERKMSIMSMDGENEYNKCIRNECEAAEKENKKEDKSMIISQLKTRFESKNGSFNKNIERKGKKDVIIIKTDKFINVDEVKTVEKEKSKGGIIELLEENQSMCSKDILPTTLPFEKEGKSERKQQSISELKDVFELKENEPFLIQFPRILPFEIKDKDKDNKGKNENEEKEEKPYVNPFEVIENNSKIGKLKIYKSGKMKMEIGNILFDVTQGIKNTFIQEILLEKDTNAYILSRIKPEKLIVSPEI